VETIFTIAAIWLGLAILSTVIAYHLKMSIALIEICVGVAAASVANYFFGANALGSNQEWLRFLASTGAILLTFLTGAELDKNYRCQEKGGVGCRVHWIPGTFPGLRSFGHWSAQASWLAGIALSTTSMAVVYAVMLETGFNRTDFGKGVLGAYFINDLGTVIALGLIFAPFTYKTLAFSAKKNRRDFARC